MPKSKKVAPTPAALLSNSGAAARAKAAAAAEKKTGNPLFEKRPRDTGRREYLGPLL